MISQPGPCHLAFGLPSAELNAAQFNAGLLGEKIRICNFKSTGEIIGGKANYAYLMEWDEFYAPAAVI